MLAKITLFSLFSLVSTEAFAADLCKPPQRLVKEAGAGHFSDDVKVQVFKGEVNGVAGEWTVVSIDKKYAVPETHTSTEREKLKAKLKDERTKLDVLLGRDNHFIHDFDIFKNGLEAYGSYLNQDAEQHFYMNWEFGVPTGTCILEFEATEIFTPKPDDIRDLRRPLADVK